MALPVVVIIGRPNVGKSSLLNLLARERVSIVDPRAGITRDRISVIVAYDERYFELIDTGGLGIVDDQQLDEHVEAQIRFALDRADIVLFVVDVASGLTTLDQRVAELLRKADKRTLLVVNKVDDPVHEPAADAEFARLGFGERLCVSAVHARGRTELLERVLALLGDTAMERPDSPVMKLAIVGKRNSGKSTLVNALAGEPRMIVSEIPGTTRDAVDVQFEKDGRMFVAIDTAGVRKRARMNDIDFYSYTRAVRSIRRADVVLLLIEALVPVSEIDLKLAAAVLDEYKPVVIGINKWDLGKPRASVDEFGQYIERVLPHLRYAPITFLTAQTGKNVDAAVDVAWTLHRQAQTRVPTGRLNAALREILAARGPSAKRGNKPVRLYYATQVSVGPPTIVLFCNDPSLVREEYRRYLENRLRERLPFAEVPLRLWFRPRGSAPRAEGAPAASSPSV